MPTAADRVPAALADRFGRIATDLRVSVMDKCNLRCTYCMPAEGLPFLPKDQLLSREEIVRLVALAVDRFGVRQVRFTGGEPLVRADLADIVRGVAALPERPEISITTNGVGLAGKAALLREAGVDRVNVSLDSLCPETFAEITRRPVLEKVLAGIDALAAAGFQDTKVNTVLLPGVNELEAPALLEWALAGGHQLRFIEQMPLDADHRWARETMVTAERIRALLSERFVLEADDAPREGAPAELYTVRARRGGVAAGPVLGRVGVIASVTEPFCADCRRTRLTAEGRVRSCLFSHTETDLRDALRSGAGDEELATLWRQAMWAKPKGHTMSQPGFRQPERTMSAIGG